SEDTRLIQLARLPKSDVEQMIVAGWSSGESVPPAVIERVVSRADGVPLFVEEVARMLAERDGSAEPDRGGDADSLSSSVPGPLRDLLAARLDQLSPAARKAAQQGAALGREFRLDVLLGVSQQDERSLRRALGELLGSGLLHRRPAARVETYVFKH